MERFIFILCFMSVLVMGCSEKKSDVVDTNRSDVDNVTTEELVEKIEGIKETDVAKIFIVKTGNTILDDENLYEIRLGQRQSVKLDNGSSYQFFGGKYGFINKDGALKIMPNFDSVGYFSDGLANVRYDARWCYINKKGKIVFDMGYIVRCEPFSDGLAGFTVEYLGKEMYGFIDLNGDVVIEPKFVYAEKFENGLATVAIEKGIYFYIDKKGNDVFGKRYDFASDFNNGFALVKENSDMFLIDTKGNQFFPPDDYILISRTAYVLSDGSIRVENKHTKNKSYWYVLDGVVKDRDIDTNVFPVDLTEYEVVSKIQDDYMVVENKRGYLGVVDVSGKFVIPCEYEILDYVGKDSVGENMIMVMKDQEYNMLNTKGEVIWDLTRFYEISDFNEDGMARFDPRDGMNGGYLTIDKRVFRGYDYIKESL